MSGQSSNARSDTGCVIAMIVFLLAFPAYLIYSYFHVEQEMPPEGVEIACLEPREDMIAAIENGLHEGTRVTVRYHNMVEAFGMGGGDLPRIFFLSGAVSGIDTAVVGEPIATWEVWRLSDGGLSISSVPGVAERISVWPQQDRGPFTGAWQIEASRICVRDVMG